MSTAPYLPPVFSMPRYTPPINPQPLPPFVGGMDDNGPAVMVPNMGPPTDAQLKAGMMAAAPCDYNGPFCFGLDTAICGNLPATATILPGIDVPICTICGVVLNTICGVTVAIILLTILGIAFYGLVT